jgi:hypothetical protein
MTRSTSTGDATSKVTKSINEHHLESRKLKGEGKADAALIASLRAVEAGLRLGRLTSRHVELAIDTCLDAKLPRIGEVLAAFVGDDLLSAKALIRLARAARRLKKPEAVRDYIGRARAKGLTSLAAKSADRLEADIFAK